MRGADVPVSAAREGQGTRLRVGRPLDNLKGNGGGGGHSRECGGQGVSGEGVLSSSGG